MKHQALEAVEAFPLHWPATQPRTRYPKPSLFDHKTIGNVIALIQREVRLLGGTHLIISSNLQTKGDGLPYARQAKYTDHGVAVYFVLEGQPVVLACDRWDRIEHNLYAISKHIDAMRGMERWGVGTRAQAFAGYAALPSVARRNWWEVLGIPQQADLDQIKAAYRALSLRHHPDRPGGDAVRMAEINRAFEEAQEARA